MVTTTTLMQLIVQFIKYPLRHPPIFLGQIHDDIIGAIGLIFKQMSVIINVLVNHFPSCWKLQAVFYSNTLAMFQCYKLGFNRGCWQSAWTVQLFPGGFSEAAVELISPKLKFSQASNSHYLLQNLIQFNSNFGLHTVPPKIHPSPFLFPFT